MCWRLPCKEGACTEEILIQGCCCCAGLLGGAVYVNAFTLLAKEVEPSLREFSLAAASLADSVGIAMADICGILVQVWLQLPIAIDCMRFVPVCVLACATFMRLHASYLQKMH